MQFRTRLLRMLVVALVANAVPVLAQDTAGSQVAEPLNPAPVSMTGRRLASYILGPGDEISIVSIHAPEIAKQSVRINTSGDINLALVGRFHASGKTVDQLEDEVRERLATYIKDPEVGISVSQMKSQPVSVLGAIGSPGVIQLEGVKTLVEVLSLAGGIRPEAGAEVKITRRLEWGTIPLPSAKVEGDYSTAVVNIRAIENATRPEENIQILPYDVISIARAEVVYVMGEGVRQSGAFTLSDRKSISVIEALARAQGTAPNANLKDAKVIRPVPGGNRVEIAINLRDVLNGKTKDIVLQADDILYVSRSELKGAARRTLESIVSMTTGMIIYR